MTIKLSYIIVHRARTPDRTTNLCTAVCFLQQNFPDMEIIVVEQDEQPSNPPLPASVRYIFTYNSGSFNRSWGLNVGFFHASHDVVAFADNDIVVPPQAITEAYQKCLEIGTASPYASGKVLDLSPNATKQFIDTLIIPEITKETGHIRCGCNYAGGILFMAKSAFLTVGGWDEELRGWGGEDTCMARKIKTLIKKTYETGNYCIHLHHQKPSSADYIKYRDGNAQFLHQIWYMREQEMKDFCKSKVDEIGNPNLYCNK